jgi:signal transduction histidine kinase
MRRLVEQLLDLSRVDTAKIQLDPQRIRLKPHIEDAVAAVAVTEAEAVRVGVPDDLEVVLDPAAVDRIVTNLVANALRYGAPPIVVTAVQTDHHVRIHVQDGGKGVAADFVPFLFDRFRRSRESRDQAAGTGLGLAIARSYARAHGGDLFYRGETAGAHFELVVPAERVNR